MEKDRKPEARERHALSREFLENFDSDIKSEEGTRVMCVELVANREIFIPLWPFYSVVDRGRFSLPASALPHGRHSSDARR
ncbi:hypothetical protein FCM35_KLT04677 [Carex littledalei]|uniref:Uncharacterized protein n=1 Tax=Carex littledalei TaxID=544730 RepID=A0A833R3G8_9POAL|nr:hypothetical protein FCM35_KLT04677 [Carex littledalei]